MGEQEERARTFVSIELTEDVRRKLEELSAGLDQYGAKPVSKENLHITLFFLGDINGAMLAETKKALAELSHTKFYVSVKGIGTFSSKRPNVIFANVEEGKDAIILIYRALFKRIKLIVEGIDSREYHPHITIARTRPRCDIVQLSDFISRNSGREFGRFLCSEIKIKSSTLTDKAPGLRGPLHKAPGIGLRLRRSFGLAPLFRRCIPLGQCCLKVLKGHIVYQLPRPVDPVLHEYV